MQDEKRTTALEVNFTNMKEAISRIESKIDGIIKILDDKYVTKESFTVVKNIVFGMV